MRNFLSIDDMQVLRMRRTDDEGTVSGSDYAFIYGPNSSGKSNLIKAMDFSRKMIIGSKTPNYEPHMDLDSNYTSETPSYFEYVFELDGFRFSYGFEIDLFDRIRALKTINRTERYKLTNESIKSEWLYLLTPDKDIELFSYEQGPEYKHEWTNNNGLHLRHYYLRYRSAERFIRSHIKPSIKRLEIVKSASKTFNKILPMFSQDFLIKLSEPEHDCIPVPKGIVRFLSDYLQKFDTGITEVIAEPFRNTEIPINLTKKFSTELVSHTNLIYIRGNSKKRHWLILKDEQNYYELRFKHNSEYLARIEEESIGTRKIIQLLSLMASRLISENGCVIVVDEIECSIHALAIEEYVKLFKKSNKNGSQLIFTTHQHRLLSSECSTPEDIWFMDCMVEDHDKKSELYALKSFVGDLNQYAEMYLDGRFSAVPIFTSYTLEGDEQ